MLMAAPDTLLLPWLLLPLWICLIHPDTFLSSGTRAAVVDGPENIIALAISDHLTWILSDTLF